MAKKTNNVALIVAICAGILAIFLALFYVTQVADYYLTVKMVNEVLIESLPYNFSQVILVLSEGITSFVFVIFALFLWNSSKVQAKAVLIGIFRALLLLGMFYLYWDLGWYYILDPSGTQNYILALPALGVIQSIAFMFKS